MKELISGIAMLLLLSVFLVQFTTNQVTHDKLLFVQDDIETYMQEVKQEGYLSDDIKNRLKEELKKDLKQTNADGITISSSKSSSATRAFRGELIDYTVKVKVKDVIGAGRFFGISSNNNYIEKTYSGYVASEWVG